MKRRIFSAILTASMLLTQSVLVFGEEATETTTAVSIPYTQNFEDATLTAKNYSNSGNVSSAAGFEQQTENGNGYGRFHKGVESWLKVGFQVDEKGVTDGKLNVSFRFRPYDVATTTGNAPFVALGDTSSNDTAYLSILAISGTTARGKLGVLNSSGSTYQMKDSEGNAVVLPTTDDTKWFKYNAVIDLDTRSIDVEVVREEDGAKYTYSATNIEKRTSGWSLWPATTKLQTFVAMGPIDIDDLSITHILKAQKLTFVSANGAESDECSIFTSKAKVTFNAAVKEIPENAVTMDGKDCSGGVLSDDGMTYTFDIPENLISGTAHKVAVDTSKLEPVVNGVLVGDGEEFDFTVADIGANAQVYTQNFEDATLTAKNYSNSGNVSSAAGFEQQTENGNGYGRFHKGVESWLKVGFQVDEKGVTDGKLNVSFRFRPYDVATTTGNAPFVALGDTSSNDTAYLSILAISGTTARGKLGVLNSSGSTYQMKDSEGNAVVLPTTDDTKWFKYNAVIDLDTRSIDVEVVREEDGAKYTYSATNIEKRTSGWGLWPATTKLQTFVAMGPIDIDDLSITYDTNPSIVADATGVEASVIAATEGNNRLIIAQYDDAGRLVDVTGSPIELEAGQSVVLEAKAAWAPKAKTAKAFIWDDFMKCTPLGIAKLASKPASTTEGE